MFRNLPTLDYCGLTIILSNPSRFDLKSRNPNGGIKLISGNTGNYFDECIKHVCNRYQIDIRIKEDTSPLLAGTKCVLVCGESAMHSILNATAQHSLNEVRGYVYTYGGVPAIATYSPQDCLDVKDYEGQFNTLATSVTEQRKLDAEEKGRQGATQRKNFRHWFKQDIKKILYFLTHSASPDEPRPETDDTIKLYPDIAALNAALSNAKHSTIFLDIETDPETLNLTCIGLAIDDGAVSVVPIFLWDGKLVCEPALLCRFFLALRIAMKHNMVVIHNAMFDLLVLSGWYGIPFGRNNHCTMIAQHRLFPENEKSLGHCISQWTYHLPYHKDSGIYNPQNSTQAEQLYTYNGKDINALRQIYYAQLAYAATIPGASDSIKQACACIHPYLITTLQGMPYNKQMVEDIIKINDAKCNAWLRVCKALVGHDFLPSSPKQCVDYCHGEMNYKIIKVTPTGKASLDSKAIQQLRLLYRDNPMLELILKFRETLKESGSLKFKPWRDTL